jgi:hypothetical protein
VTPAENNSERRADTLDWLLPYSVIVRMFELSERRFAKLLLDWRLVYVPWEEPEHHAIKILLLARDPAAWEEPACAQMFSISREEYSALAPLPGQLLELLTLRIEVVFRVILDLLARHNPARGVEIAAYAA